MTNTNTKTNTDTWILNHTDTNTEISDRYQYQKIPIPIQGVSKKMRHFVFLISLATNILENWDIIHWKGGIHRFVWSTKTFLYDIREPRYKQIKMGYQISKCLDIGKS